MGDLTSYFSKSEFICKCGCGRDNISMELVEKLQRLRVLANRKIVINSGCRCIQHNKDEEGKVDSAHICEGKEGEAADIHISDPVTLWILVQLIFEWKLFTRVGIGKTVLHVDISKTLPGPRIWPYTNK